MNKLDLKELYDNGHLIGSHTVSHPVMSTLNKNKQYLQIKKSFKTLKSYSLIEDIKYTVILMEVFTHLIKIRKFY